MTERVIIAGAGGQGIMLLGKVLAEAAMRENKQVSWFPSYGAEVRGGTAYCMVVVSDQEIASPYVQEADTLIIMNQPSLERFKARIKKNGLLIINSSLANPDSEKAPAHFLKQPFTGLAIELGNIKVANIIALGYFLAQTKLVQPETVMKVIEDFAPQDKKELVEINQKALLIGTKLSLV